MPSPIAVPYSVELGPHQDAKHHVVSDGASANANTIMLFIPGGCDPAKMQGIIGSFRAIFRKFMADAVRNSTYTGATNMFAYGPCQGAAAGNTTKRDTSD